jgi:hypothetical protein
VSLSLLPTTEACRSAGIYFRLPIAEARFLFNVEDNTNAQ